MVDFSVDLVAAINTAFSTAKAAFKKRDEAGVQAAQSEINGHLVELLGLHATLVRDHAELQKKHLELHDRVKELESLFKEAGDYEQHITVRGGSVYRKKSLQDPRVDSAYLCANCFTGGKKTFLQPSHNGAVLQCHTHGAIPSDLPLPEPGAELRMPARGAPSGREW
jgi:hypothetical protein